MELALIKRALQRHLGTNNLHPYERVLQSVTSRGDVWATSQGEYIAWWKRRREASFRVWVSNGQIVARSNLDGAVLERYPGRFVAPNETTVCGSCDGSFSGEVRVVVDATLERKALLIDALQREGILNYVVGESGEFFLSHELDALLEEMETHLRQQKFRDYDHDIHCVRDAVAAMLAKRGLALVRVWYHPQINGRVIRAVFSPRYDVDRAITNMAKIIQTERKYGASSTLYVRTDQPFYGDEDIAELDAACTLHEIALHTELSTHAAKYGSDMAAAQAEKAHLERIIGRPVTGISLHGGELTWNRGQNAWEAIEGCGFGYDSSHGPAPYYLPYRRLNGAGQLENTYRLRCHFRDIDMAAHQNNGAQGDFYGQVTKSFGEVLAHNGVMALLLHPEYFGFLEYLCCPKNLARLLRFAPTYLIRVLKMDPRQQPVRAQTRQRGESIEAL